MFMIFDYRAGAVKGPNQRTLSRCTLTVRNYGTNENLSLPKISQGVSSLSGHQQAPTGMLQNSPY